MLRLAAVLVLLAVANYVDAQQVLMRRDTDESSHDKDIAVSDKGPGWAKVGAKVKNQVRKHLQNPGEEMGHPNPDGHQPSDMGAFNNQPGLFLGACFNAGCADHDCEIIYRYRTRQSFAAVDPGWLHIMNSATEMDGQRVPAANFQNISIGKQCPGTRKLLTIESATMSACVEAVIKDPECSKYFDVTLDEAVSSIQQCRCMKWSGSEVPPHCPATKCDRPSPVDNAHERVCAYHIINPHLTAC